jgi:type IV secretory pathway VirB2 component (pilin)
MFLSFIKNVKVKFYPVKNFRMKFPSLKNFGGKLPLIAALLLLQAASAYAQLLPDGMSNLMTDIIGIFTGEFVKGILICSLAGSAIAYGFNRDNEKIKRNCIAIAVACAILMAASEIVKRVTEAAGG